MVGKKSVVIVGGGQAAAWAAKTLRQQRYSERIVIIGGEKHPPYERPPLSKKILTGESGVEQAYVFSTESYADLAVDLRLGTLALDIDVGNSRVRLGNGADLPYDQLLLATGGTPRKIDIPGILQPNVFYLRDVEDTLAIREHLAPGKHLLIIGGGWIGLEVAAAARKLGARATVVEYAPRLCGRSVPPDVSDMLLDLHRGRGVDIRLATHVKALEGTDRAGRALLSNGETLDISAVVVGIGLRPAIDLAACAGLAIDNGIFVDECWMTSVPGVFAAGDVANFVHSSGRRTRLESWENAQKQGIAAAMGMLGVASKPDVYPWFWSDQYDKNVQLLGDFDDCDDVVALRSSDPASTLRAYLREDVIAGAVGVNAGRDIRLLKRILESGRAFDARAFATSGKPLQEAFKS